MTAGRMLMERLEKWLEPQDVGDHTSVKEAIPLIIDALAALRTQQEQEQPNTDREETTERNPKSWAVWKRQCEAAEAKVGTLERELDEWKGALVSCHATLDAHMEMCLQAERQPTQTGWHPIETAPKENDVIILTWDGFNVRETWWFLLSSPEQNLGDWSTHRGQEDKEPTHWRPLPTPPEER